MKRENLELASIRLTLIGCGRMGAALLKGWLHNGLSPENVSVLDPRPSEWLQSQEQAGVKINPDHLGQTDVVVLATKPRYVAAAVTTIGAGATNETVFISIAAGVTIAQLEGLLNRPAPVVRAMPNTPAEIGYGITGIVANQVNPDYALRLASTLMQAVGRVITVEDEDQMHAITAVSGSGPAYIFSLAEAMEQSGINQGLPQEIAQTLAVETIRGAGMLMALSVRHASELREAVTSPGGTTAAGLDKLRIEGAGLNELIHQTISAAAARSRSLAEENAE